MENPAARVLFPSKALQILSAFVHIFGTSLLSHCISRRLERAGAISTWTWARLCSILIFIDSWLFLFSSGILIFGIGLETSLRVCSSAIFLCIAFYGTSKVLIYFFLAERIHVVWQPPAGVARLKSKVYIICLITVLPYIGVIILMIWGRVHHIRDDGACVIGLKAYSSIFLLTYDLYINVFLTGLFLWPILRSNFANPRVRRMAVRTVLAASISLTTSSINVTVLTILHGKEFGWLCLASCGIDVIANALAIFWVTSTVTPDCNACISLRVPDINSDPVPGSLPISHSRRKSVSEQSATSFEPGNSEAPHTPQESSSSRFSFLTSLFSRKSESSRDIDVIEITVTHHHSVVEEDLRVRPGRSAVISTV